MAEATAPSSAGGGGCDVCGAAVAAGNLQKCGQCGWRCMSIRFICFQNCHSHVATALEGVRYRKLRHWNMVMLAFWVFFCGRFISFGRFLITFLPSIILYSTIIYFQTKLLDTMDTLVDRGGSANLYLTLAGVTLSLFLTLVGTMVTLNVWGYLMLRRSSPETCDYYVYWYCYVCNILGIAGSCIYTLIIGVGACVMVPRYLRHRDEFTRGDFSALGVKARLRRMSQHTITWSPQAAEEGYFTHEAVNVAARVLLVANRLSKDASTRMPPELWHLILSKLPTEPVPTFRRKKQRLYRFQQLEEPIQFQLARSPDRRLEETHQRSEPDRGIDPAEGAVAVVAAAGAAQL